MLTLPLLFLSLSTAATECSPYTTLLSVEGGHSNLPLLLSHIIALLLLRLIGQLHIVEHTPKQYSTVHQIHSREHRLAKLGWVCRQCVHTASLTDPHVQLSYILNVHKAFYTHTNAERYVG